MRPLDVVASARDPALSGTSVRLSEVLDVRLVNDSDEPARLTPYGSLVYVLVRPFTTSAGGAGPGGGAGPAGTGGSAADAARACNVELVERERIDPSTRPKPLTLQPGSHVALVGRSRFANGGDERFRFQFTSTGTGTGKIDLAVEYVAPGGTPRLRSNWVTVTVVEAPR